MAALHKLTIFAVPSHNVMKLHPSAILRASAAFLILILSALSAYASTPVRISGRVIDASNGAAIDYADVLLTDLDDNIMASATADKGVFVIYDAPAGEALLTVYIMGYDPYVSGKLSIGQKDIDLGIISLSPSSDGIQEVTVTGEKNMIVYKLDRQRISGSSSLAASGGTAVDVMAGTPSVQTDSEGNVTLRGSSNYLVYVDGHLSPLEGTAALQQIPAASIEDIEIMTTPSARYRTDGDAGIINIITRKDKTGGWSGMLNLSAGTLGTWNVDGDLTYTKGHNSWYAGGTFQDIHNRSDFNQEKTTVVDGVRTVSTADGERWRRYGTYTGRAGWQFVDGRKHNLSLDFLVGKTVNWRGGDMAYTQDMGAGDALMKTEFDSHDRYKLAKTLYQYSLAYIWRPADGHEITTTSRLRYDSYSIEYTESNMFDKTGARWEGTRGYEEEHHWDADGSLIWKWSIADACKLESGYQYTTYSEHGGYRIKYWNREAQEFEWQDDLATPFYYRRQVHSLYTMATGAAGRFSYDAGIRADRVLDVMDIEIADASRDIKRFNIFPSAHASYDAGRAGSFSAGFSYRTNRPGIWNLEPYITYEDYFTKKIGNPDINPEYISSAEIGWRKTFSPKAVLSVTAYFHDRRDIADWVRRPYEPGVTLDEIVNAGGQTETGLEMLGSFKPASWWSTNVGASGFYYDFKATNPVCQDRSGLFWKADWMNSFSIGKDAHVQFDAHAVGPRIITQGREDGFFYFDLAGRKSFLKGRLTFSAVAHDVLHTAKYNNIRETEGLKSVTSVRPKYPNFIFSLSYRFNASNRKAANVSSDSLFEGKEF